MKEFEGNFECLGENTEKYITFSVPIKKKIENKDIEITYKIKLIDSFRFMATSLSKLVDNLTEDIHGDRCVDCKSDLSYMKVIDEALIFRCFNCKKNYEKEINKELIERFASTYKSLPSSTFISLPGLAWQTCLKKTGVELELLTDYDMLLMIEEGIRGGICHAVHRYAKADNEYMKDYDESKESSYIQYLDANNLYGAAMSEKLPMNGFKWVSDISGINKKFVKSYDKKNSDKGYILEVDVDYQGKLHKLHSDMPFLPERMKINKTQKLVCNLRDKKKYVVHISILKQALDHGLKLKKVHRVIEFNQEAWLKKYIDMNTELRKKASNDFEKDFLKLMNNAVFSKTMENVRKHRDIKLVKTNHKRNKLVSEPNYDTMMLISENLSIIEMKKVKVKMKKPIYLGLSILEISKIIMYEFWYDYVKKKYGDMVKLCYMDTDSLIMNIKTKDFYKDIAQDVEERFDTSNYDVDRPLPKGKNKKVIGLMKDELGGGIITEFVALRPKTYSYMTDEFIEMKKAKGTKKCVTKKMLKFEDYKKCLFDNEPMV